MAAALIVFTGVASAAPADAQPSDWYGLAGGFVQGGWGQATDVSGTRAGAQAGAGGWLSERVGAGIEVFGTTLWRAAPDDGLGRAPSLVARRDVGAVALVTVRPGGGTGRWRVAAGGGVHRVSAISAVTCCAPSRVLEERSVRNRLTLTGGVETRLLPSRVALFARVQYTPSTDCSA